MNSKVAILVLGLASALLTTSCLKGVEGAITACGDKTLEELKTQNVFTPECKAALRKILPSADNNLTDAMVGLGSASLTGGQTVFLAGASATGSPLALPGKSQLTVTAVTAAGDSVLDTLRYVVKRLKDVEGFKMSTSVSIDYSGSMSDDDVSEATDVFRGMYTVLDTSKVPFEGNLYRFSDMVTLGSGFTDRADSLKYRVRVDSNYARGSTALYDAMGVAITALSTRTAPVKILVIATDGGENNSRTYKKASALWTLARQHKVRIFVLATLVADLPFIREAARETGGLYAYSGSFLGLADEAEVLSRMLSSGFAVQLKDAPAGTDSVRVTYGSKTVTLDL
jgi:hypothetical protein